MNPTKNFLVLCFYLFCVTQDLNAQQSKSINQALDSKQQSIVTISAFTAIGDLVQLRKALSDGLDARLTINEIKEILVQLYAYTGFPRSLNALNTFIAVLKERKSRGIDDQPGKDALPLPTDESKLQFGTEMQTKLVGTPVRGEVYQFAPAIDQFLKEHLFGDIFGRDNLDWKTRELATIAALAALGNVEGQLRSHFGVGIYNGLTAAQLTNLVSIIQSKIGSKEGDVASQVLQIVLGQNQTIKTAATDSIATAQKKEMIIRIAEIEIHPNNIEEYKAILKEGAETSMISEPGVISIFPMYQKTNPAQIRILEIYASREAYELHLETPHFQKYKTTTLDMVKSLQLTDMEAIDAATMTKIFSKLKTETIFPKGGKITNNNFIGNAWLQQMIMPDSLNTTQVGTVTFEPGARSNWHLHPAGQILLITGGTGYYQEKGSAKRIIKKGDVIKCPPNVMHWHGASKDEQLIQIAITNTHKGAVVWLEKVTDEEYNN